MKATDLMIGDWIQSFGEPHKIIGIRTDTPYPYIKTNMSDTWYEWGMKDLADGIPLTPEIMEKNGFVKVPHEYEYPECQCWTNDVDGSYSFEIVADEHRKPYILGNGDMGDYEWVNFECKYLHELQHALRLTGIRKEINL